MRIVDLFSGCGGFGLGAELAGFQTAVAIDLDPTLQSAYKLNFPSSKVVTADVSKLDRPFWHSVLGDERIAGVIGGPPCQGFSRMGKKDSHDPRNSLIGHFYRQVKILKPKFFIMENVVGILDSGSREHLFDALAQVPKNYTVLAPMIINAADHGAATKRLRVVVIGYDPSEISPLLPSSFSSPTGNVKTNVREAIEDLPPPIYDPSDFSDFGWAAYPKKKPLSKYAERMRQLHTELGCQIAKKNLVGGLVSGSLETKHTLSVVERFREVEAGTTDPISRYPRLKWDGLCPTLRAGTGAERGSFQAMRPIHPAEPRVITVREGARLQGFPDWFMFHPSKWHSFRMIGNSVSPLVGKHLLSQILAGFGVPTK